MSQKPISLTCRVLSVVSSAETPMRAYEVARRLGCPCNTVRVLLGRLVDAGKVQRIPQNHANSVTFWIERDRGGPHVWDIFGVR